MHRIYDFYEDCITNIRCYAFNVKILKITTNCVDVIGFIQSKSRVFETVV